MNTTTSVRAGTAGIFTAAVIAATAALVMPVRAAEVADTKLFTAGGATAAPSGQATEDRLQALERFVREIETRYATDTAAMVRRESHFQPTESWTVDSVPEN